MNKGFFALGLSEHRLWGIILLPIILRKNRPDPFYITDRIVFPTDTDEVYRNLSHTERELVKICDEYNDKNLFKYFSKNRSLKEFQEKVTDDKISGFIRPFIEKRISKALEIVRGTDIPVFMRDKSRTNTYDEDFLKLITIPAEPVFRFSRSETESRYTLDIKLEDKRITLQDRYTDIICDTPAIVRIGQKLLFIKDIEARKIKPFFTKTHIAIPKNTEAEYFKKFILNIIRDYEVEADGFRVNLIKPSCITSISIERNIDNQCVVVLRFSYLNRTFLANSSQKVFVDLHRDKGEFYYNKYSRDAVFEESIHEALSEFGLITYDQVNYELKGNRALTFEEQFYNLLEWVNTNSSGLAEQGLVPRIRVNELDYYLGERQLEMSSKVRSDWFDIHAVVKIGEYEIPFWKFRRHILDYNREYMLPDGRIFILPGEWFSRFREMFEFGEHSDGAIRLRKQHFAFLEKAEKGISLEEIEKLDRLNNREQLSPEALPSGLTLNLRPYQTVGYTWLYYLQQNRLGGCLADDMGLGKTIQAIALLLKNKEISPTVIQPGPAQAQLSLFGPSPSAPANTSLVVVPASLVYNWRSELNRFAPSLKVLSYTGSQRERTAASLSSFDVVVSSYHTVRQDIDLLSSFSFHYVILDESQVIKNPSSRIYKAVNMLNCRHRLVLTGTPIENSLTDLWSQMNFANPGLLGNLNFFKREFVVPIEKKADKEREEKLKRLINPFILRRTKEEVAKDLPEISEQVIYCSMTEEQRMFYEEEKSGIRNAIFENLDKEGVEKSAMIVLQGLTRLRQISNHPALVDPHYRADSGKYLEIIRNIENVIAEGHKVLVFSGFVKHLELIAGGLKERTFRYTMLTGASVNREDIVNAFQENPDCRIFLISLKAGGVGLNLTAADYVFILDPWWNPAAEDQAVNRAHRIGQDKNVFVLRFISEDSIEEKIQKLQERKSELASTFISSNNPVKDISRKELEELFR